MEKKKRGKKKEDKYQLERRKPLWVRYGEKAHGKVPQSAHRERCILSLP